MILVRFYIHILWDFVLSEWWLTTWFAFKAFLILIVATSRAWIFIFYESSGSWPFLFNYFNWDRFQTFLYTACTLYFLIFSIRIHNISILLFNALQNRLLRNQIILQNNINIAYTNLLIFSNSNSTQLNRLSSIGKLT